MILQRRRPAGSRTPPGRCSGRISGLAAALAAAVAIALVAAGLAGSGRDTPHPGPLPLVERSAVIVGADGRETLVSVLVDARSGDPAEALQTLAGDAPLPAGAGAAFAEWMRWPDEAIPIVLYYSPQDALPGINGPTLIEAAMAIWNAAPGHSFEFRYGGTTTSAPHRCGRGSGDGVMSIGWRSDLPPGTLATTCAIRDNGVPVEVDITFSTSIKWVATNETPDDSFDFRSTLLHELGHVLGLDHSSVPDAVMQAQLSRGQQRRQLTADDIAGIQFLYPDDDATAVPSASPSSTATPSPAPILGNRLTIAGIGRD